MAGKDSILSALGTPGPVSNDAKMAILSGLPGIGPLFSTGSLLVKGLTPFASTPKTIKDTTEPAQKKTEETDPESLNRKVAEEQTNAQNSMVAVLSEQLKIQKSTNDILTTLVQTYQDEASKSWTNTKLAMMGNDKARAPTGFR